MSKLEENLINLQNKLNTLTDTNTNTSKLEEEINATEIKLEQLYDTKAKGAQIRSRVKWVEEGEKNTKFFLGL